jgi:HEAT repeat protein
MVAVMMSVLVVSSGQAVAEEKSDADIWGDPEISVAVEKVRKGEKDKAIFLTSKMDPNSSWKPAKKNLPKYHECLGTNENPQVQFFAVAAIGKLKDKSSVEPLQKFIVTANHRLQEGTISDKEEEKEPAKAAQRRLKGGIFSREESVMIQLAIGVAMEALGEIDDDSDLSVAFLGTLLKHDMPKEFGGAVAHSTLAKKGVPGLRRLLEASLTADEKQQKYVCSAIREIRDPALFGALAAASLDPKYKGGAGGAALLAISNMRDKVPQAEQFIIDILKKDEKSYMRFTAAYLVATFGSEKGFKLLRDIRNNPGKSGEELVRHIDDLLVQFDMDSMIEGVVKSILSPATPDEEKVRLCGKLARTDENKVARHDKLLIPCLKVENSAGEPLNEARVYIWLALHHSTKVEHPLTLKYDNEEKLERETYLIRGTLATSLKLEHYHIKEQNEITNARIKNFVTKWEKSNTGKSGDGK